MRQMRIVGIAVLSLLLVSASSLLADAPLADAVQAQDETRVAQLLKAGAKVNAAQVDGMTSLHWAVYHDDLELSKQLLTAGADATAENRYGVPPLWIACKNGNGEIVELLLEAGADPETTIRGGETVLMTAARTGRIGPVKALIAAGADVDATERSGQSAIMWAAADGHAEVVDALIESGAEYEKPLRSGFTPYFFAVREGQTDVVFRLLEAGIDINSTMRPRRATGNGPEKGTSALVLAVLNGHFELAARLLEAGADPNDDRAGFTALHAITWVRKPLRGDGDPPPIGSGSLSSLELVRLLVEHGADVNARHGKQNRSGSRLDKTDATPFLLAAETGDLPLMKLLLDLGADPHLTNVDHCTPLLAAAGVGILGSGDETAGTEEEAIAAVKLLLELGADINAVDENGETAMHGAAYKSWTKLIRFLADNGADASVWNQKNSRKWTPLMIAQGHRPGNFRPSAETIFAVQQVMREAGVEIPTKATPRAPRKR